MAVRDLHTLRAGDLLAGRYRIGELLGEGGYGRVLQATQLPLEREVAIKIVNATDSELAARFVREAAIIRSLEHPNTVRVLDIGTTPEGDPFLVLELLRGQDLDQLLGQRGSLPVDAALHITAQVLKSLAEAHAKGIVHRDIKPGNVFITSHFGEPLFVKVLDFGIAKQLRSGEKLTAVGEALGTPSYMAPEQAMGMTIDARTDLYALGLMLAEMVTGKLVFAKGGPLTIVDAQAGAAPAPLGADVLASAVGPIVVRAVRKDPSQRYQSAAEMLRDVEETRRALARPAPSHHPTAAPPEPMVMQNAGAPTTPQITAIHQSAPSAYLPVPPAATVLGPTLRRAPAKPAAKRRRTAIVVIVLASAALATVLVSLSIGGRSSSKTRDETGETDESESEASPKRARRPAPVSGAPASADSGRSPRAPKTHLTTARARTVPELKRAFTDGGYKLSSVQAGSEDATIYTFMVHKDQCDGSIVRMVSPDATVESQASAIRASPSCRVTVDGLVIVYACFSVASSSPCLDAAAKLLVK